MPESGRICHVEGSDGRCWLETANESSEITPSIALALFRECLSCDTLRTYISRSDGRRNADRVMGKALGSMLYQLHTYDMQLRSTGDSLRRKVVELTIVNQVSDAMARTSDVDKTMQLFLVGVTAGAAIGLNRALLFLVEGDKLVGTMGLGSVSPDEGRRTWLELAQTGYELDGLIRKIAEGGFYLDPELNRRLQSVTFPLNSSSLPVTVLTEREARRVQPCVQPVGHPVLDELYRDLPFVAVPLSLENEAVGVLLADNFITRMPIPDETVSLLQTLANQAAAEIVMNRLHADLEQQLAETEHLYELLRENQNYLLRHERLVDMGKLATTVAHEIKTPLVAIGGFARRALKGLDQSGECPRHELEVILREVQRLERITEEILDYSKEVRLTLEPMNLQAALDEAIEVVEGRMAQAGIEIERHYSDTPCEVQADPRRIKQVMLNLLENAIEAMSWPENGEKGGGKLTLTTRMSEDRAMIELEDTGPGIAPDIFDRVFTPFFTTKPTGSGLGLPVSRRIISDHGGQIRVESPSGGGTRFIIELPRNAMLNNHVPEGVANGQDSRG